MNRQTILFLLLTLTLLTGCSQRETPPESALYQHYVHRQDLKVAQVNGFKLCDTVHIDVVMLQAESDQAWQQLMEEFNIRGEEGSVSWLGEADNPAQRILWTGIPAIRVIASHSKQSIGFYRIESESQYDALIDYQLEKTKNKN